VNMKGLVSAGGAGHAAFAPSRHTGAKQLVPVANRPVLMYVMDNSRTPAFARSASSSRRDGGARSGRARRRLAMARQAHVHPQDRPGGLAHAVATASRSSTGRTS